MLRELPKGENPWYEERRIVAICGAGPRQEAALKPICDEWIPLPAGSFREHGTNVNAAIVVIDAENQMP